MLCYVVGPVTKLFLHGSNFNHQFHILIIFALVILLTDNTLNYHESLVKRYAFMKVFASSH